MMAQAALSDEGARSVYALLLLLGAPASAEANFIFQFTQSPGTVPSEWRFQGMLGGGGKLYLERERWRVGCYKEDDTPERIEKIAAANALLDLLRQRYSGGDTFEQAQESGRYPHPRQKSGECRFCGAQNETGTARCLSCDRTMWDARGTSRDQWHRDAAAADEAGEREVEKLIDDAAKLGKPLEIEWTSPRARALEMRTSKRDERHFFDVIFRGTTASGSAWTIHLRPPKMDR